MENGTQSGRCSIFEWDQVLSSSNVIPSFPIHYFPNPTTGKLNIDLERPYKHLGVDVYNSLGQLTLSSNFNNERYLELMLQENPGLYTIRIRANNKTLEAIRIIKL